MPVRFLILFYEDIVRLIFYPLQHWKMIRNGDATLEGLSNKMVIPGLIVVFISTLIGDWIFKTQFGWSFRETLFNAIRITLMLWFFLVSTNFFVVEVTKSFNIPAPEKSVREIVTWAMVPMVLAAIITGFFPFFKLIWVGAFYGLYLVSTGIVTLFDIDKQIITKYITVLVLSVFLSWVIIALLLNWLTILIL